MSIVQNQAGQDQAQGGPTGLVNASGAWVLLLACLTNVLNYYDRTLLSALAEPVRTDLGLTDGQFGVLNGIAFAIVYSLVAIPVAQLADRFGRARILSISLGAWSVMTGLCATATGFISLGLYRLGVGLGEAGGLPSTQALVSDSVSEKRRGNALSLLAVMSYCGMSLSGLIGAPIAEHFGWRAAFLTGAVPGLILCLVLALTVKDRPRLAPLPADAAPGTKADNAGSIGEPSLGLGEALGILFRRPAFMWLCFGLGLIAIANLSIQAWGPAFFMREFERTVGEVGIRFSMATAPAQVAGTFCGGFIADYARRRDLRWPLWMIALSFALTLPLNLAFLNAGSFELAMLLLIPASFFGTFYIGPAYLLVQELSGPRLRATGAAVFLMIGNLLGLGVGPTATGFISDFLAPAAGTAALGQALSIVTFSYIFGIAAFLMSSRTFVRDFALANPGSA